MDDLRGRHGCRKMLVMKNDVYPIMIQIECPNKKVSIEEAQSLLEPAGVKVDKSYVPVCVNPKLGRYVLRGTATEEAKAKAEQIKGVQLFRDVKVSPARS